jgi:hypothetical protein
MMHGGHLPIVPGDRDRIPTRFGDNAAITGIALPINAGALLAGLALGVERVERKVEVMPADVPDLATLDAFLAETQAKVRKTFVRISRGRSIGAAP